jgi:Stage II sporulation protein E (SpoIIE)/7TM diverse intracellular signalling
MIAATSTITDLAASFPRSTMRLPFALVVLLPLSTSLWGFGQIPDLDRDRIPITELTSAWRFHVGDVPRWSRPEFDDSSWSLLTSDRGWNEQGYRNYTGIAWYRLHVVVPPGQNDLAIMIPRIRNSYSLYANGRFIGQIGAFPPKPSAVIAPSEMFLISRRLIVPGQPLVIALRVWFWPALDPDYDAGLVLAPVLGDAATIARWRDLQIHDWFWSNAESEAMIAVNVLSALLALVLFAFRRSEREYLWYGIAQFFWLLSFIAYTGSVFLRIPDSLSIFCNYCGYCGGYLFNLVFFHALFRERPRVPFSIGALAMLVPVVTLCVMLAGWTGFASLDRALVICSIPYAIAVTWLLVRWTLKRKSDAWLLLVPYALDSLDSIYANVLSVLDMERHPTLRAFDVRLNHLVTWPFIVGHSNVVGLTCVASVSAVLILRFTRSRRDEERLEAEFEAARTVQQVLVPAEIPSIPGFRLEAVYKPASQVGGDFFQIVPIESGGALIAIGDVSGKGMPAAMTVSLLVGTFRTLAHYTLSPGEILVAMNRRMLGRSKCGFTTCLVLRVDLDGSVVAANAGHIMPYVDGRETDAEIGLPLGISADSSYPETKIQVPPGSQLALVTDGIVEARNVHGDLFGFDRTAVLSRQSAGEIAAAAQSFGQEDDITVLTLCMEHEDVPAQAT